MHDITRPSPDYLLFLVRKGLFAEESLSSPFALEQGLLQSDPEETIATLKEFRALGRPEFVHFLDLHLIAHTLLFRDPPTAWITTWLDREVDFDLHFPGLSRRQVLDGTWSAVPVPVVHGRARVVYLMTGMLADGKDGPLWPDWADRLMDDPCKSAVNRAALAAASVSQPSNVRNPFCFPLLVPAGNIQIKGSSLGLALALGFLGSSKGKPVPRNVIASGAITGSGGVGPVEALERKIRCAEKQGFNAFLYPSGTTPPGVSPRLELLPVSNLAEARMFAELYEPGRSEDLQLLSKMIKDPDAFVANMDLVTGSWLDWVRSERMSDPDYILRAENGFVRLVEKTAWALRNWNLDRAAAMAALISPSGFDSSASSSPLAALRFCTQNMALSNHRGDVAGADTWAEKGERLLERALRADINGCSDFLNNRFITRHNRYLFSPTFPEHLADILRCLEERYAAQCRGGCFADRVLGELYGSICQNFGFCGSSYLSHCRDYARKAMQAFGGGDVPELREDFLRQCGYLAHAEIDAGEKEMAQVSMFAYLEAGDWEELRACLEKRGLSRWRHALLARFLAETSDNPFRGRYLEWALANRSRLHDSNHPFQLWLYNLGRIAHELFRAQEARLLWEESLRLCREKEGVPTINVMALLPLSGLATAGRFSCADLSPTRQQVLEAAETLNPGYFRVLWQEDFEKVLQRVWEKPGDLFPFTYR